MAYNFNEINLLNALSTIVNSQPRKIYIDFIVNWGHICDAMAH